MSLGQNCLPTIACEMEVQFLLASVEGRDGLGLFGTEANDLMIIGYRQLLKFWGSFLGLMHTGFLSFCLNHYYL